MFCICIDATAGPTSQQLNVSFFFPPYNITFRNYIFMLQNKIPKIGREVSIRHCLCDGVLDSIVFSKYYLLSPFAGTYRGPNVTLRCKYSYGNLFMF